MWYPTSNQCPLRPQPNPLLPLPNRPQQGLPCIGLRIYKRSIRGRVRPSVRPSVRRSVRPSRIIFRRVLGASFAVYPALLYLWRIGPSDCTAQPHHHHTTTSPVVNHYCSCTFIFHTTTLPFPSSPVFKLQGHFFALFLRRFWDICLRLTTTPQPPNNLTSHHYPSFPIIFHTISLLFPSSSAYSIKATFLHFFYGVLGHLFAPHVPPVFFGGFCFFSFLRSHSGLEQPRIET